jgi:SAM-dependent methyltransferase
MNEDEYYRIAELETTHWWYRALHKKVLDIIENHFKDKTIEIIDAGCGTGGMIKLLYNNNYRNIKGFDISDTAVRICNSNKFEVFKGRLENIKEYFDNNSADAVICNDSLYFLGMQEQKRFADDVRNILRDNGIMIINMPALKAFRGIHDIKVGIRKRFSSKLLWSIFDKNYFSLINMSYWPFLISPFIFMSRFRQRLFLKNNNVRIKSDLRRHSALINKVCYKITGIENRIIKSTPWGSSLFFVMKKN